MCVTYPVTLTNSWFNPHYIIYRVFVWFNRVFVELLDQVKRVVVDITELCK